MNSGCISLLSNPCSPSFPWSPECPCRCPRGVVSFASAVYLIFVGLVGLNGIYHIVK